MTFESAKSASNTSKLQHRTDTGPKRAGIHNRLHRSYVGISLYPLLHLVDIIIEAYAS